MFAVAIMLGTRAEPAPQKLYVTNSAGNDLHVVDTATNKVIRRVEVGPQPHGLVLSCGTRLGAVPPGSAAVPAAPRHRPGSGPGAPHRSRLGPRRAGETPAVPG